MVTTKVTRSEFVFVDGTALRRVEEHLSATLPPLPQPSMDWQAGLAARTFEAGGVVEVMSGGAFFGSRLFHEEWVMIHECRDDFEVVGHVGPHV